MFAAYLTGFLGESLEKAPALSASLWRPALPQAPSFSGHVWRTAASGATRWRGETRYAQGLSPQLLGRSARQAGADVRPQQFTHIRAPSPQAKIAYAKGFKRLGKALTDGRSADLRKGVSPVSELPPPGPASPPSPPAAPPSTRS